VNDDALRALVREAVARHLGAQEPHDAGHQPLTITRHASHDRYTLPPAGDACLIEPAVRCNHCGYCLSHGH
jgi:hypothetical protein